MAEIKWVKLTTDMFDNRKIKHLRRLPEGNNIVLLWVMLLTMAGRCNAGGMIFLTENIPYTSKMLADELGFEENTVKLALTTLEQLNMIVTDHGFFSIAGWEEYQNIEGMERIREQTRLRNIEYRKRKKEQLLGHGDAGVTSRDATDIDIEEDKELEEDIISDSGESAPTKKKRAVRHKYGEYNNVLLTDEQMAKLQAEFPDWPERIERLSAYMASHGKSYKDHLATIRNWAKKDQQPRQQYRKQTKADELQDAYSMMAGWANDGS